MEWLIPLLSSAPAALEVMPPAVLVAVALERFGGLSTTVDVDAKVTAKDSLLIRLHSFTTSPSVTQLFSPLMDQLQSSHCHTRAVANFILTQTFTPTEPQGIGIFVFFLICISLKFRPQIHQAGSTRVYRSSHCGMS